MKKEKSSEIVSYQLSPTELANLQNEYGRPGEIAPGQPAPKKRSRLDNVLKKMDRTDNITPFNEEEEIEPDIKT